MTMQLTEQQKNDIIALANDNNDDETDMWVGFTEDDTRTWVDAAIIRRGNRIGLVLFEGGRRGAINVLGVGRGVAIGLVDREDEREFEGCYERLFAPQRSNMAQGGN